MKWVFFILASAFVLAACSSNSTPVSSTEAAEDGLATLRSMAAESDSSFYGYESASDVGNEELGDPLEVKTLDFTALLANDTATDSLIIAADEYLFPVNVRSAAIESIRVMKENGQWEYLSSESKEEIETALQIISENSLNIADCFLLELDEVELVFIGYESDGRIMVIPLYDSTSPSLVSGTKYVFTEIASGIKSELQTSRDEYNDMLPPVSEDIAAPEPPAADVSAAAAATAKSGKVLGLTLYAQEQEEWCWAASGRMTMVFLGGDSATITQCAQANAAQSQTTCCTNGSSAACNKPHYPEYDKWGFTASYSGSTTAPSFETLKSSIDAGKPLVFGWQWNAGGGHYMTAVGYYEDTSTNPATKMVNIMDPWPVGTGKKQSMPYAAWAGGTAYDYTWGSYFYNITKN